MSQLLQDTHKLLEHQIEIAEIHKKNASQQKTLIHQQQEELAEVKGELQEVKNKAKLQRDQHKEEAEEWRKKVKFSLMNSSFPQNCYMTYNIPGTLKLSFTRIIDVICSLYLGSFADLTTSG